jgi:hypothetical protein
MAPAPGEQELTVWFFAAVAYITVIALQFFLMPAVVSAIVIAGCGYTVVSYFGKSWQVLTTDTFHGPSPVEIPSSARADSSIEPAYRVYIIGQVWRDVWVVLRMTAQQLWRRVRESYRHSADLIDKSDGMALAIGWPTWLGLTLGLAALVLPLAIGILALAATHAAVVTVAALGWLALFGVLGTVERALLLIRHIVVACPHPGCWRRYGLPEYACPREECGERHRKLTPNWFGIRRHVCRCGARLPTLIILGRFRLASFCPHCRGRLPARSGRVRIEHIPFVGGPNAGKSTFLCLVIGALRSSATVGGGKVTFEDHRDERTVDNALELLGGGKQLRKTIVELPRPVMIDVQPSETDGRIVYLFDPAGEYYASADAIDSQRYLDHAEVALVIVDPLAITGVLVALTDDDRRIIEKAAPANMTGASQESAGDVVERLVSALRNRPDRSRLRRVLVVVTKTDVLRQTSVGAGLAGAEPDARAWLADMGWANWSRALDQCSDEVHYFASGLDREQEQLVAAASWLFGISIDQPQPAGSGGPRAARVPWVPSGRYGQIPLSYQVGRGVLLACSGLISVLAVTATVGLIIAELFSFY